MGLDCVLLDGVDDVVMNWVERVWHAASCEKDLSSFLSTLKDIFQGCTLHSLCIASVVQSVAAGKASLKHSVSRHPDTDGTANSRSFHS